MFARALAVGLVFFAFAGLDLHGAAHAEVLRIESTEVDEPQERASISAVFSNLAVAYRTRDIKLYREQYHPSFVYLAKQTKGDEAGERGQVTHAQDIEATTRFFEDVKWVEYGVTYETPTPSTIDGFPADEGFWQVHATELDLRLEGVDPPQVYSVNSGPATFVFKDFGSLETPDWRLVLQRNDE